MDGDIKTNVFQGIIIGLSASGLFDHTKIMKRDADIKMKKTFKHISSVVFAAILALSVATSAFVDRTLIIPDLPKQSYRYGVGAYEGVVAPFYSNTRSTSY